MIGSRFFLLIVFTSILAVLTLPVYAIFYVQPSINKKLVVEYEKDAGQHAIHLSKTLGEGDGLMQYLDTKKVPYTFSQQIDTAQQDFHIIKVKLFSSDGEIIFSTDSEAIGQINSHKYFHEIVATGKT